MEKVLNADSLLAEVLKVRDEIRNSLFDQQCVYPHELRSLLQKINTLIDVYYTGRSVMLPLPAKKSGAAPDS
jgi:hypothetical protein